MDCPKAETAMMHYIEKTLKPADARDLAKHVLSCAPCRALYLLMDASAETAEAPLTEAPEGFTGRVMERVVKLTASEEKEKTTSAAGNTAFRILWGLSGIVMGVALLFALNPHWLEGTIVYDGMAAFAAFFTEAGARLTQTDVTHALINSGLGIAALVFAGIIAALLYGLHRGENREQESQA